MEGSFSVMAKFILLELTDPPQIYFYFNSSLGLLILLYAITIVPKLAGHLHWGKSPFISLSCLDFFTHCAHGQHPVQLVFQAPRAINSSVLISSYVLPSILQLPLLTTSFVIRLLWLNCYAFLLILCDFEAFNFLCTAFTNTRLPYHPQKALSSRASTSPSCTSLPSDCSQPRL